MITRNIELGLLRLYYVVWAVLFCGSVVFAIGHSWDRELNHPETLASIGLVLAAVIVPAILMHVIRWIYRGFTPK